MQIRHLDGKLYFEELASTSDKYFTPYIKKFINLSENTNVLEIGCGAGGNLLPLAKAGCKVTGVDLSSTRIEQAELYFSEAGCKGTFITQNIFSVDFKDEKFDLILVHDVIEHIYEKEKLLNYIQELLRPQGICFIGFPAWQMPFGGHQQICKSKFASHVPFIHLAPRFMYKSILKMCNEKTSVIDELLDIKRCKTTIESFERIAQRCNWKIVDKRFYFINPHYEIKFGLRPRILSNTIGHIPYVRNYFSTSCFYILSPTGSKKISKTLFPAYEI